MSEENLSDSEYQNMSEESEELYDNIDEEIYDNACKKQKTTKIVEVNGKLSDIKQQMNYLLNTLNSLPMICENKYTSLRKEYIEYYQQISDCVILDETDPSKLTKLIEIPLIQLLISEIDEKIVIFDQMIHDHNQKKILKILKNDYMKEFMITLNKNNNNNDDSDNDNNNSGNYLNYFS